MAVGCEGTIEHLLNMACADKDVLLSLAQKMNEEVSEYMNEKPRKTVEILLMAAGFMHMFIESLNFDQINEKDKEDAPNA